MTDPPLTCEFVAFGGMRSLVLGLVASGLRDSSVDIGRLTSARSLAEYVSMLAPVTLAAPPGTSWAYSNVNYDVAARLVEIVSGRPFAVYVREAVFEPLGMRHSSVGGSAPDGYNSLFGLWFSRPELSDGPAVNGSGAVMTNGAGLTDPTGDILAGLWR